MSEMTKGILMTPDGEVPASTVIPSLLYGYRTMSRSTPMDPDTVKWLNEENERRKAIEDHNDLVQGLWARKILWACMVVAAHAPVIGLIYIWKFIVWSVAG